MVQRIGKKENVSDHNRVIGCEIFVEVERIGRGKSCGKRVPDRGNKGPEVGTSLFYRKDQSWPSECEEAIGLGTGRCRSSRVCGPQVGFGVLFSGQWEVIGQLCEGE